MPNFLNCPNDPTHASFLGLQHVGCEFTVELDKSAQPQTRTPGRPLFDLTEPCDLGVACAECRRIVWEPPKPITFTPDAGQVLSCNFSGFQAPEMVKIRPVVVVSDRSRNRHTCIVVPISSVLPTDPKVVFVAFDIDKYAFLDKPENWAKCETVNSVRLSRLYRLRDRNTRRTIDSRLTMIDPGDLAAIREGIRRAVGLS